MISLAEFQSLTSAVPEGFGVAPLFEDAGAGHPRVGILVRKQAEPVGGSLILLRDHLDARVYLGAVIDVRQRVHQWVEIWVQTADGLLNTPAAMRDALTNAILDDRWRGLAESWTCVGRDGLMLTGWESRHPRPLFVRPADGASVWPASAGGTAWTLCEDDALLEKNGLPPYRSSLHRYLCLAEPGQSPVFCPLTTEAPTGAATVPMERVLGGAAGLVPVNPEGGLLAVRPYQPLSYEEYLEILNGGPAKGVPVGRTTADPLNLASLLGHPDNPGRIFLGATGAAGQLVETLHLKLATVADMLRAVSALVKEIQRPHLNLTPDAFRVSVTDTGTALPHLWTARVSLVEAGEAVALPIQTSEARYYLRGRSKDVTVFLPQSVVVFARGRCGIRIRQIFSDVRKGLIVEGTFQTRDDLAVHSHDLVWFRVNLPTGSVDLYGHLEEDRALAFGEWRFRTVGQKLQDRFVEALKVAEGVPLYNTPYEVLPLLSTPCDLYALAVLAVKTLLVNGQNSLAVALDEVMSLAHEAEARDSADEELAPRIEGLFRSDPRWGESLGPHRVMREGVSAAEAFGVLPASLWWDVLAMIVRMLPGASRFAVCRDLGDAPPRALQEVMDRSIRDADLLLLQTRGLIVTDWEQNREIRAVLEQCRAQLKAGRL